MTATETATTPLGFKPKRSPHVPDIVVLDYGSGNIRSAERAVARTGARVTVTADRHWAVAADGLVVPGVGAFAACMEGLLGVDGAAVIAERLAAAKPVLAICVGHQVLFANGIEHGVEAAGCGIWSGTVSSTSWLGSSPYLIVSVPDDATGSSSSAHAVSARAAAPSAGSPSRVRRLTRPSEQTTRQSAWMIVQDLAPGALMLLGCDAPEQVMPTRPACAPALSSSVAVSRTERSLALPGTVAAVAAIGTLSM